MSITEEQAREKWCPMVRYTFHSTDSSANRWKQSLPPNEPHALNPLPCRCIAPECMMWRWHFEQTNKQPSNSMSWPPVEPTYSQTYKGYCGLAGGGGIL